MATSLDQWQERLQRHFAEVASSRSYTEFPLFALEHGLTDDELDEITELLHAELEDGWRIARYWLVWVVYATEIGYDYDGDEYWLTFEQRTPKWKQPIASTRRNQLRTWFSKFQTTYHGVSPSGPWAEWFSIIAWPITHAILPRYLQWQFAKTLYDLRFQLANLETLSPNAVGALLATDAWDASSRFREFLQQQELAGRIVLALLSDRTLAGQSPIYPQTLQRLVSDLEEVQSTREWLKETRRLVADRLKGAAPTSRASSIYRKSADGESVDHSTLRLRPTLMLRRSTASTWSIIIEIPSFADVARSHPDRQLYLRSTRCKVPATGDTWYPRGWLLMGYRRQVLKSWPGGTPLLTFEQPNVEFDQLVAREIRLPSGPTWLCRIGGDGLAREIASHMVRPGRRYILLSETEITSRYSFLSPCKVNYSGIFAVTLTMPESVSFETTKALQQLGLQVARTVRIWPAGLSGRNFDGEGYSEWLTTEAPCFGIVHDHAVDTYSLRLNNGAETLVKASGIGVPVFFQIGMLSPGRHTLLVKARALGTASLPMAEGVITLDVREPEPWIPGTTSHAGLAIALDSNDPSLDAFWEGSIGVGVSGPAGHQVTCEIRLHAASGKELSCEQIGTFDLPVTPTEWTKKFSPFVRDESRTWTYLEAASGRFIVKGDELGEYSLRLERDVSPLRWLCRNTVRITTLRLIDDTGGEDAPDCQFLSYRNPARSTSLNLEGVIEGFEVEAPGGLFEVRHGKFRDTINVSIPPNGHGFTDLAIEPDLRELDDEHYALTTILEVLRLWSEARLVGPLVGIRRNRIIERLANRLYSKIGGQRWADAEAGYLADSRSGFGRQRLERALEVPHSFSVVLSHEFDRMENGTSSGTHWFANAASRYHISTDRGLCEFALQFASRPHELLHLPRPVLEGLLNDLKRQNVLLRAARFVALLAAHRNPSAMGNVFPRWKW